MLPWSARVENLVRSLLIAETFETTQRFDFKHNLMPAIDNESHHLLSCTSSLDQ